MDPDLLPTELFHESLGIVRQAIQGVLKIQSNMYDGAFSARYF